MWYNQDMRNQIALTWENKGKVSVSHFELREFEGEDGLVVVDPGLIRSLELTRRNLCEIFERDVEIVIKSGTRSEAENERLAEKLGWVEDGGAVAHDSRHLPRFGGIAVDCYARYPEGSERVVVPQASLESACKLYFVYVKADYPDGHVHADNRSG